MERQAECGKRSTATRLAWLLCLTSLQILMTAAGGAGGGETIDPWLYICQVYHVSQFLFGAEMASDGCGIECTVLTSSSPAYVDYFDAADRFHHNLKDGIYCRRDHICSNGSCIPDSVTTTPPPGRYGFLRVTILKAKVPKKDTMTPSDPYVSVCINGSINEFVGKTRIVMDNNEPEFNESFISPRLSRNADVVVTLDVRDYDMTNKNDRIAVSTVSLQHLFDRKLMGKEFGVNFSGGWVQIHVSWLQETLQTVRRTTPSA